jgi:hypothetical protein
MSVHPMRHIEAAASEMRAAHAILVDPACDDSLAALHLVSAWTYVASATGVDAPVEDAGADITAWLNERALAAVPQERRSVLHEQLQTLMKLANADLAEEPPSCGELSSRAMMRHMRSLRAVIDGLREPVRSERVRLARVWGKRILGWGAVAAAIGLLAWRPWQSPNRGPWRGAYYPSEDFRGKPTIRRDMDVNFDWGREAPLDDIPADRFGVRWDSCLTTHETHEASFQLISDDGSRLFIDGERIIDNWGKHGVKSKGKTIMLEPGVHHLRIEYFDLKFDASIAFFASFDGTSRPAPIPATMLDYPRGDVDDPDPCGSGER